MTTLAMQKDLLCDLKQELSSNIGLLIKLKPISQELSYYILKHGMEKLTRPVFNELSYYLVNIIDSHACTSLPWPLYDSKMEKVYRNELCQFINNYRDTGILSPIMSSYLVNPGCFKVIMLLYQMSTLALQRILLKRMSKDRQKTFFEMMTKKFISNDTDGFLEEINNETDQILCKFSKYMHKRTVMTHIAEILRNTIVKMDETLHMCEGQNFINDIIDKFLEKQPLNDDMRIEVEKIKDVSMPSTILDTWLNNVDAQLDEMEQKWNSEMNPFLKLCQTTQQSTQDLIARYVGETDKNTYMIEYNHKTDEISTKDLQSQVNMEQKYVLKNMIKDGRLNFPYLIRGFLVAICYMLKNTEIEDDIYKFNEYLDNGKSNYNELVSAMKILIERVSNAESKLQPSTPLLSDCFKLKRSLSIPPIPDLSDLRSNRIIHNQVIFNSFTPLNTLKHHFNLFRKKSIPFVKPHQLMLTTPFHQFLKEDTLKCAVSCRMRSYNRQNISQNFHNLSIVPKSNAINETISECGTGFTKHQIQRLLSTIKKSSTSKKCKLNTKRPSISIKKGGLFNESITCNENNVLIRSYSSPNLFENIEKRSFPKCEGRRLSIMQEHLEVSGIVALENENSYGTPKTLGCFANLNATSLPIIIITPEQEKEISKITDDFENDVNKDNANVINNEDTKTETPKNNIQLVRKTNSLEKIINRFKKVKANMLNAQDVDEEHSKVCKTIVEEKENLNTVTIDVFATNRKLLPDLLSPSFSRLSQESTHCLDEICYNLEEAVGRKPRESLGAALGVDQTFLDQFDLID